MTCRYNVPNYSLNILAIQLAFPYTSGAVMKYNPDSWPVYVLLLESISQAPLLRRGKITNHPILGVYRHSIKMSQSSSSQLLLYRFSILYPFWVWTLIGSIMSFASLESSWLQPSINAESYSLKFKCTWLHKAKYTRFWGNNFYRRSWKTAKKISRYGFCN